ncbi:MAG TPA: c-type cytochrome [Candidatus Sulfotelmatobacter sp.]|jgi:mono/diheme cytochrome c family protein
MKKLGKILLISAAVLAVVLTVAITFTIGWRPFIGPKKRALTNRQFERTPERLARGKYLVQGLLDCESCHSPKDWTQHGGPIPAGMELAGQAVSDDPGFPGKLVIPNITPDLETGIGKWTDDQIARAIREGIRNDDTTLFPMMPYEGFKTLSDDDIASVVVYLRSVAPVKNALPPMEINFPVNYLVRSAPEPITEPVPGPNMSDPLARGKYMVTLGCGCHNPTEQSGYGGGERLKGPWGDVVSANLTSDPSGIRYYTEGTFISAMRTGFVGARKLNSIMPFIQIRKLSDDDLKAIFAYLKTLPPVKHRVDNTLPPTYCKVCKQKHGAGDQNKI